MTSTSITYEFHAVIKNSKYTNQDKFYSSIVKRVLDLKKIISPNDTVLCTKTNTWEDDTLPFLMGLENNFKDNTITCTFVASCVIYKGSVQHIMKFCEIVQAHLFPHVLEFTVEKHEGDHIIKMDVTEPINPASNYFYEMTDDGVYHVKNYGFIKNKERIMVRKYDEIGATGCFQHLLQRHSGEAQCIEIHRICIGNGRDEVIPTPTAELLWRGRMYGNALEIHRE